jgi:hypothetical protein
LKKLLGLELFFLKNNTRVEISACGSDGVDDCDPRLTTAIFNEDFLCLVGAKDKRIVF